jgi:hypothetical protein
LLQLQQVIAAHDRVVIHAFEVRFVPEAYALQIRWPSGQLSPQAEGKPREAGPIVCCPSRGSERVENVNGRACTEFVEEGSRR